MIEVVNVRNGNVPGTFIVNGWINIDSLSPEFEAVQKWISDGKEVMPKYTTEELLLIQKEEENKIIDHFTDLTSNLIQRKVDEYNELHSTRFDNVHHCANYRFEASYTHQVFCSRVWDWNVRLWDAVRTWHDTLAAVPTDADWQAVVDGVLF